MPPRSSSPICERSLDLTLIGIGRRDIPQCSSKHFHTEAFYRTFSGGQTPSSIPTASPGFRDTSPDLNRYEQRGGNSHSIAVAPMPLFVLHSFDKFYVSQPLNRPDHSASTYSRSGDDLIVRHFDGGISFVGRYGVRQDELENSRIRNIHPTAVEVD